MRLADLLDLSVLQKLADANFAANGMPIGIVDAIDGSVLVGAGWQDVCVIFHRANPDTLARCRESDGYIKAHLERPEAPPCEYLCKNGLRDIGIPIRVAEQHLATLFLGQFFYEGESPDERYFADQAREFGFDPAVYLAAVRRVPVFRRAMVENVLRYNQALASFIANLAEGSLRGRLLADELRAQARRKDEFLAMLSHELRNPLAPIQNALHVLDHPDTPAPRARHALDIVRRQVSHLTRLVDDLLDVTRIVRRKIEIRVAPLDVVALVRRAVEDYRAVLRSRGLTLQVELPGDAAWVNGDEHRLVQIIGNLLHNAAKFTSAGGTVTVALARRDGKVELSVRDDGRGIRPALLELIFDPFTQADQGLARTDGGLGLGLSLVKGLAELHGGTVVASSAGEGFGSAFTVSLPLARDASARPADPAPSVGPFEGASH